MAKAKLTTDRQVAALRPSAKPFESPVGDVRGLAIRTFPSGTKAFEFRYVSAAGVRRRLPLGSYPGLSLAEASKKARALRVAVVGGADPAGERLADRSRARTGETLSELAEAYWIAAAKGLHGGRGRPKAASTLGVERTRFDRHIQPKLGDRRFKDLVRADIKVFMRELAASEMAADSVASIGRTLSAILNFAVHEERLDANPATGLTQPRALVQRERMFPDESMRALWGALYVAPVGDVAGDRQVVVTPAVGLAIRTAILTLTRRADVSGARWEEVDRKARTWTIPAARHKSRRPHVVPLTPEVEAMLDRAAQLGGTAGFIFPSPVNDDRHVTEHGLTRALSRLSADLKIPHGSPHDFRRTGATHLTSERLGVRRFVVSKVLGHVAHEGATVTAVYDRNEYLADKRRALEAWEGLLLEIVGDRLRADNVVSIATTP